MGWMVAASVGAVEALKDQLGVCRWNYALRLMHQRAMSTVLSSFSDHQWKQQQQQQQQASSSSYSTNTQDACGTQPLRDERAKRTEETMRKIMQLSAWGPN